MSYTIVNFIDPNDGQPTVAIFNEDRSRVSICENVRYAINAVRSEPDLDAPVSLVLLLGHANYIAALRVALAGEGEPFIVT